MTKTPRLKPGPQRTRANAVMHTASRGAVERFRVLLAVLGLRP